MHPLEALGLGRDADERAVKRAYAQRLRTTRPDEDPAGFQKLHETYQAALSFLRWRAENPDAQWWGDADEDWEEDEPGAAEPTDTEESAETPSGMPESEFEALIGNPRYARMPEPEPAPAPAPAPRPAPQVERVRDEPEPFRLDVRDFLKRLFEEVDQDDDAATLRVWLARETGDWPLMVKPRVAHDLLGAMLAPEFDPTPEQLEVIAAHFDLDDVRTGVDPIGLEELRARADRQLRRRRRKFAHLFHPDNRGEFARYMSMPERGGGYPQVFTRFVVFLLTNRRAYEWAFFLRPVPFLNRMVMRFLRDVDLGRFDAFGPYLDGTALQFWEWAEIRREANRGWRYVVAIVGLIVGIAYVTKDPPRATNSGYTERPGRPVFQREDREREQRFAERIRDANAMEPAKGLVEYDAMLRELPPPPWSASMEEIAALARYNRGVILDELKRLDEAKPAYEEVDRLFQKSRNWPVQLITAKALVNLGHVLAVEKRYRDALLPYQQVVARYGDIRREQFDIQVAMALDGRAASFRRLGEPDEAGHALDELLRRFGDRRDGELGKLVAAAREQRRALNAQGGAPSPVPGEPPRPAQ